MGFKRTTPRKSYGVVSVLNAKNVKRDGRQKKLKQKLKPIVPRSKLAGTTPRSLLDPTRLGGLRRRAIKALRTRYHKLGQMVRELMQRALPGPLPTGNAFLDEGPVNNEDWSHESNPNKIKRFRQWLRQRMESTLAGDALIQSFIDEAYRKGASRGFSDLRRSRVTRSGGTTQAGGAGQTEGPPSVFLPGTTPGGRVSETELERQNYMRMRMQKAPTVEKVKMLASRTFSELEDVNTRMATGMSRTLAEGLASGWSVNKISKQMAAQTGIAFGRVVVITRTELIRTHAEAQLDTLDDLGEKKVGVAVEWQIAVDSLVCPRCATNEGKVFTIDEARGMIPVHPNCRCAWIPLKEK